MQIKVSEWKIEKSDMRESIKYRKNWKLKGSQRKLERKNRRERERELEGDKHGGLRYTTEREKAERVANCVVGAESS